MSSKNNYPIKITGLLIWLFCYSYHLSATEIINFDSRWQFHLGDMKNGTSPFDSAGKDWRVLDLPHDWSIEGKYDQTANGTDWQSGFLPAGIGWYRKSFLYEPKWDGKKVRILFDGIYLNSEVWINGHLLGKYPNGYLGFVYDLTPYLIKGENQIVVKVDHSRPLTGRWYTGSGIYRHVHILVSNPTYIPYSGVYFKVDSLSTQYAKYSVEVEIETDNNYPITLSSFLKNREGEKMGEIEVQIKKPSDKAIQLTGSIKQPIFWSPETPNVYTLVCQIKRGSQVIDEYSQTVGFRSLGFSPEFGFKLNGKQLKIKGVCDHHTAGAVGAAVPEDILYYRLSLLKEMGCNAIRTSHNPFSPEFYTMCDTMGFMVLNEGLDGWDTPKAEDDYGNYFDEWWEKDMTAFIKRDRNHPSVIMWSIGNEVRKPEPEVQQKLVSLFHTLDPTRPVTQGGTDPTRGMSADYGRDFSGLDIVGFNGNGEEVGEFERFREKYPQLCVIGTEVPHSYQTRGVYRSKTQWRRRDFPAPWEKKNKIDWDIFEKRVFPIPDLTEEECFPEENIHPYYQSSYDNASVRIGVRHSWQRTCSFPWLMGEFRWGSFDYLGEAEWPQRCGNFGIIDIAAIPKDTYYLYKSLWNNEPMVHVLPHWSHTGKEGKEIPVVVYTNCDSVELFLNNESLGVKPYVGEQLVWFVPFTEGKIEAKGIIRNQTVVSESHQTASSPYSVTAKFNKQTVKANSNETIRIELDIVDKNNIFCPCVSEELTFTLNGPIRLLGVDNGDPVDMFPYKEPHCKTFRGKCVLLVQPTAEKGTGTLQILSENLKGKTLTVQVY